MANDNKSTAGPDKAADKATGGASTTPDAQVNPATTNTQATVQRPEVEPYATTTADAIDPATGDRFDASSRPGWAGRVGFETGDAAARWSRRSTRTGFRRRCRRR
jgi:hypothetical protein